MALRVGSSQIATVSTASTSKGFGWLAVFLLPFAGFGIFAGWRVLQRLAQGNWREALFFLLFAVVFGGVGLGGLALVRLGRRKLREQEELKAKHPDEPWHWQKDWSSGRIEDASR
jgi:hypothetical protein